MLNQPIEAIMDEHAAVAEINKSDNWRTHSKAKENESNHKPRSNVLDERIIKRQELDVKKRGKNHLPVCCFLLALFLTSVFHLSATQEVILPEVKNTFYELSNPKPNEYVLSITFDDFDRQEVIKFQPLDSDTPELQITGETRTFYDDINKDLVVKYVADSHGYRANFTYISPVVLKTQPRLSVNVLKSGGGG
uniref:Uncharacterized protein n=1 Tax=Glossina pallidipes TaxID=7398 RepID=A0A1B0A1C3_GLOPL